MDKSEVIFRVKDGMVYFSFVVDQECFDQVFLERVDRVLFDYFLKEDFKCEKK